MDSHLPYSYVCVITHNNKHIFESRFAIHYMTSDMSVEICGTATVTATRNHDLHDILSWLPDHRSLDDKILNTKQNTLYK